jgi:hypothetical protein
VASQERVKTRGGACLIDEEAISNEHDAIGPRGQLRVMGGNQSGDTAPTGRQDEPHDRLTVLRVECARRFVG